MEYAINPVGGHNGTFTNIADLTFVMPNDTADSQGYDGNLPANRTFLTATVDLSSNPWGVGESLYIQWTPSNRFDVAQSKWGMDDVSFSAIPEPSTMVLVGLTALAALVAGSRRRKH